jgi:putative DNA primase/helicase
MLTPDAFAEKYPAKALDPSVSKVPKPPFDTFDTRPATAFPENRLDWPEPKPLPVGSICLPEFDLDFLPQSLRPWIADIQDRMQCSTDFLGVTALVALGSLIGKKVGIRPRRKDDWIEFANLWGVIVGRPGFLKSPAMAEVLKPLKWLEAKAKEKNVEVLVAYDRDKRIAELRREAVEGELKRRLKSPNESIDETRLDIKIPTKPRERRLIVQDVSYEKLGAILSDNPNGVLVFRDEIVSLLKDLSREERAPARGMYLTGWDGKQSYDFDRIGRGGVYIPSTCISLLGSTQPGVFASFLRQATEYGSLDDGLVQRFGLIAWPNQDSGWKDNDRYPDSEAKETAWNTIRLLAELEPFSIGAEKGQFDDIPFLRFDADAQGLFSEWRPELEARLRSGDLPIEHESYLAKHRKLVPALALISHLADGGTGSVSEQALQRALMIAQYAEAHAGRAFGSAAEAELEAARAILERIRTGDLKDGFTCRDVYKTHRKNLSTPDSAQAGLNLLLDHDWLVAERTGGAGRPSFRYLIRDGGHDGLDRSLQKSAKSARKASAKSTKNLF